MPLRQLILISVLALAVTGCGQEDVRADAERELRERTEQIRADVERRADALGESVRARRERIVARIEEVLGDLEQIIPEARVTRPEVQRRAGEQDVEQFLTGVIENVDAYWTRTLKAAGRPEPRVSYVFVEEGRAQRTGCRVVADDRAAFYCPADDTIYVAQRFAADLYAGVLEGLPGGGGRRRGASASPTSSRTSTRTTSSPSSTSFGSAARTPPSRSSCRPTAWQAPGATPRSPRAG